MSLVSERLRALGSPPVSVIAGIEPNSRTFVLPRDILTRGSQWFSAALRDERFLEGNTLVVRLPEDSPAAVEALLYFVDNDRLDHVDDDFELTEGEDDAIGLNRRAEELKTDFEVWMLGQKYLLPALQNAAVSRIGLILDINDYKDTIPLEILTECYRLANGNEILQLIVADYVVDRLDRKCITVSENLGACPGFIAAMHASEEALHAGIRGNFPRFHKPRMFEDVLRVKASESVEAKSHRYCEDHWAEGDGDCDDCGYRFQGMLHHYCGSCYDTRCRCGGEDWEFRWWKFNQHTYQRDSVVELK